jgi:pimeloyl-ACP methyl ester carboxylesterase
MPRRAPIDLLDTLGVDRPVTLVALAFGRPIAAEFAVHHPDGCSALSDTAAIVSGFLRVHRDRAGAQKDGASPSGTPTRNTRSCNASAE